MKYQHSLNVFSTVLISGFIATDASAHSDLGGLMPFVDNGKIMTGHYDAHGGTGLVTDTGPTFVYITELEADWEGSGIPGSHEPGFVTDGASPADPDGQNYLFPANTALTLTANSLPTLGVNAAFWDGSAAVNFTASPHDIMIEGAFDTVTFDGTGTLPAGSISPWTSDAVGIGHGHLEFMLNEPDATANAGVYLFSLTLNANGVQSSDPLYFVAGYGLDEPQLDEAIEAAEEWVESNLVPEPASLMIGTLWALALIGRCRG